MQDLVAQPPFTEFAPAIQTLFSQIAPRSRKTYTGSLRKFFAWMLAESLVPASLTYQQMARYQAWLLSQYSRAYAANLISAARSLLDERAKLTGTPNPAAGLRSIKISNESPHIALTRAQARDLLLLIDTQSLVGKRDYAIVKLLLHTGIRRSECAALSIGDLSREAGHYVATIQHGKGDKRRLVKLKAEVFRAINDYMIACGRESCPPEAPLFVRLQKAAQPMGETVRGVTEERISDKVIERLVKSLAAAVGEPRLTPHGLRATFITLALEGGASLHQTQYAAGQADPRTTERYHRRKLNLDDNAADYIRIDA